MNTYKINNNYLMFLDENNKGIEQQLIKHKTRETLAYKFLTEEFLQKTDVALDIGANIGYYTIPIAKIVDEVIAVEPLAKLIQKLSINLKLNEIKNVSTYNLALGDHENLKIPIYETKIHNHSALIKPTKYIKQHLTYQTTIDKFLSPEVAKLTNFIRMDVEGYETEIIEGAINWLQLPCRKLMIEVHPTILGKNKWNWLASILTKFDFKVACVTWDVTPTNPITKLYLKHWRDVPKILTNKHIDLYRLNEWMYERIQGFNPNVFLYKEGY